MDLLYGSAQGSGFGLWDRSRAPGAVDLLDLVVEAFARRGISVGCLGDQRLRVQSTKLLDAWDFHVRNRDYGFG